MIIKKAYTEVNEIINNMPINIKEKIPKVLRDTINANTDKNYNFNIEEFEKGNILEDTKKILSVIYTDYLSTEEERKVILIKEKYIK